MKVTIFLAFFTFLPGSIFAQNNLYIQKVNEGKTLLAAGTYSLAAKCYTEAFQSNNWKGFMEDRLNAARAWAMLDVPDSAYFNLFRIAERLDYGNLEELTTDKNFMDLRLDERWKPLCALVEKNAHSYRNKSEEGGRLFNIGKYVESAKCYSQAFQSNRWKANPHDRLNAALAWAMAGVSDSAYFHLFKITEQADLDNIGDEEEYYHFWDAIGTDLRLQSLRSDSRWPNLYEHAKAHMPHMLEVAQTLRGIMQKDQSGRMKTDSVTAQFGQNSPELADLWKSIHLQDSINLIQVSGILEKYGWLGANEVGKVANLSLFLVVQHAPLAFQEKYLPVMREAVKAGNAQSSNLALLEDRVLTSNGKRQIYGSQVTRDPITNEVHFYPIEDVDNVDLRRAAMNLGPLVEYARHFGITWDDAAIKKNKKMTPVSSRKN